LAASPRGVITMVTPPAAAGAEKLESAISMAAETAAILVRGVIVVPPI
jgi:hypothetical protein